jgi:Pyruvate/2-oxoacid:ferredoxin oxidoreductase delta subunit
LEKGYIGSAEASFFPAMNTAGGVHPVVECTQNIPCDPCQDICPKGCILVGETITRLPELDRGKVCSACGLCVGGCSGQAIFLVNEQYREGYGTVGLPYEFLPLPEKGGKGRALDRSGAEICDATVVDVRKSGAMDKTAMLVMEVPADRVADARFFRAKERG